jgi:hypothetical protein
VGAHLGTVDLGVSPLTEALELVSFATEQAEILNLIAHQQSVYESVLSEILGGA